MGSDVLNARFIYPRLIIPFLLNKRVVAVGLSLTMIFSFIVLVVNMIPTVRAPTTWYVDDEPGGTPSEDFTTIQAAVDAALPGDTVFVYNGTYYENVVVNVTINLTGEDRDNTIIKGGGDGYIFSINANWTNMTGFTLFPSVPIEASGILLKEVNNCQIFNINVSYNYGGIDLLGACYNTITTNIFLSNTGWACIWVNGNYNIISNNTILSNSAPMIGASICLEGANNNTVINNIVSNNQRGIFLWFSSYNKILKNYCAHNQEYGIRLEFYSKVIPCEFNVITNNTCYSNEYGIYLQAASDTNQIYHNNLIHNINQTYDGSSNQWDNGYPSGGNYWSDYGGVDLKQGPGQNISGSDGIGDTNYTIDAGSLDNYPLMSPFGDYYYLYEGWNLISIPRIQSDTSLGEVLSTITGSFSAVQWFNTSHKSDPWKHNCTTKPAHLNDLNTLDHTMGFWIFITKPNGTLFEYQSTQPTSNQFILLHMGWNMVGYPSLSFKNRTTALNNLEFGTDVDAIWTYNADAQMWRAMGQTDCFEMGRGYRVHATADCIWQVPL